MEIKIPVRFRSLPCLLLATATLAVYIPYSNAQDALAANRTLKLFFSTYLGGTEPCFPDGGNSTFAQNAATDKEGNIYVTGGTEVSDLPVLNAWQPQPASDSKMSAFLAKYDPSGKPLWCTYLGGNNYSLGLGIAAMPDGGAAVVGVTSSDASGSFPTMNAFQAQNNGESDYFVAVFDADGSLLYSTCLGGSGMEGGPGNPFVDNGSCGNNITVDSNGLVYVTGVTPSGGGEGAIKFPMTANAIQPDLNGETDAFLCIIDPGATGADSLLYSSFLGGNHGEQGHSVAVNTRGASIVVAGYTRSTDFPTTSNAYRSQSAPEGYLSNGFVTQFKVSKPGSMSSEYSMRYSTYLGSEAEDARDDAYGIVMNKAGIIYVTGRTQSAGFPMTGKKVASIYNSAPYLQAGSPGSGDEPYLVKINPSRKGAKSLVYSTFLGGGSAPDSTNHWGSFCASVAIDSKGNAFVGGETSAPGVEYLPSRRATEAPNNFPYTADALLTAPQGSYDAILMQIDARGSTLGYSTYLGGKDSDRSYGLSVDPSGNIIITGLTFSSDFPVKDAAQSWPGNTGSANAFVAKFSFTLN